MIQANFEKGLYKSHMVAMGTRVMWIDMQRGNMTGRNLDSLLRDGLRLTYDKHMEEIHMQDSNAMAQQVC